MSAPENESRFNISRIAIQNPAIMMYLLIVLLLAGVAALYGHMWVTMQLIQTGLQQLYPVLVHGRPMPHFAKIWLQQTYPYWHCITIMIM